MPSFDVVSEIDRHELANAIDQANRELSQRFDFKDTGCKYEFKEKEFVVQMKAQVEFQLKQMLDILKLKLTKQGKMWHCATALIRNAARRSSSCSKSRN
jgi:uncharacterized protein YajQ (UPF0234 family)